MTTKIYFARHNQSYYGQKCRKLRQHKRTKGWDAIPLIKESISQALHTNFANY